MTISATQPEGRFGVIDMEANGKIKAFREKSQADTGFVNIGFMVCNPETIDYILGDQTSFEREPLEHIAKDGQLMCYRHDGFWQCMDTMRDKEKLENLWTSGEAPWKVW
jgi:glucose-1-phosphate cytidylyltransferase